MPATFGIGRATAMLAFTEDIEIRPLLTSNSVAVPKRIVAAGHFVSLIGEFAARREIDAGELTVAPVSHPLFRGTHARVFLESGRPLVAEANELLD